MDLSILIKKLSIYKFSSSAIQWFKAYLNKRQQTIECDKGSTDFQNILSGVPQGSILGPTLFRLFVNDLPLCFEHCLSDLYADDTTVHTKDSSVNNIEHNIMCDLKNAIEWGKPNKMHLHYSKTTCMLVGTRQRLNMSHKLNVQVNDTCIQNMSKQKLLGICIDESLTWSSHIDYLCSHISTKISFLATNQNTFRLRYLKCFIRAISFLVSIMARLWLHKVGGRHLLHILNA